LVEQRTENPRVPSSTLGLGTIIEVQNAEVVQWLERLLAKEEVASSNLVFRSIFILREQLGNLSAGPSYS
jgi:hypothetical protein